MHITILLKPAFHGAVGYWDEILSFLPLVLGIVLLIVLYAASRKRGAPPREDKRDPPPPAR
jgi:hypothetical protein